MTSLSFRLHRATWGAFGAWLVVTILTGYAWWTFAMEPLEKLYIPTYTQTWARSLARTGPTRYPLYVIGPDMLVTQRMLDDHVSGVRHERLLRDPATLRDELRIRIYHGSLLSGWIAPAVFSVVLLVVLLTWGAIKDARRVRAMRGDGWQIKGRTILTPRAQARRTKPGGLEIWTEN